MPYRFFTVANARTIPIIPIETAVFSAWLSTQSAAMRNWVGSAGFLAKPGSVSLVAGNDGALSSVLLGVDDHQGLWSYAALPKSLPAGRYRIDAVLEKEGATNIAIGWALG